MSRPKTAVDQASIQQMPDGGIQVIGDLTFSTVSALLADGEALLMELTEPVVDLSAVNNCDSAGLALLLEWLEMARVGGRSIRYRRLPDALLRIARLSNAEKLLPRVEAK